MSRERPTPTRGSARNVDVAMAAVPAAARNKIRKKRGAVFMGEP
jgi:hypothetical protein